MSQLESPQGPESKVVLTIEFDRATNQIVVGGAGWEWGRQEDEALCDWMLKKAARAVEQMAIKAAQQQALPDADERNKMLRALRNGVG